MTAMAQLRYSPLSSSVNHHRHLLFSHRTHHLPNSLSFASSPSSSLRLNINLNTPSSNRNLICFSAGDGGTGGIAGGGGYGGGGDSGSNGDSFRSDDSSSSWWEKLGLIGIFLRGWKARVAADPQFPFKVLMEEVVGVTSCVIGDMASRPNFGLNELDFVFSTLVVGSILNFTLMYLLAPTLSATSSTLPGIFSACPTSHMFEPGAYGFVARCGTFVYKGALFGAVGFVAGLAGTALSNGLIKMRKKMDPTFETPNKAPPTLLNSITWALHMGLSSNFRYQALNGVEFLLAKSVPPAIFKSSVVGLRCANNVLGGMSFVALARLTGSQSVQEKKDDNSVVLEEKEKLVVNDGETLPSNQST